MRCFWVILFSMLGLYASAQDYWQQQTNYTIHVKLNDTSKTLQGSLSLEYINNSPDTLNFIWMHIWPNAFANDQTAFAEQNVQNGNADFYFSDSTKKGYIKDLNFQQNGTDLTFEYHPDHNDIIKVFLIEPLLPHSKTILTTPFFVKIPYNFSRGGFYKNTFQITQWYPKAAMYDRNGWHTYPYLEIGEYFNNFGNYDVTIELPKELVVAATGVLQNEEEKQWLKSKKDTGYIPNPSISNFKKLRYIQDNVTDFAWFVDPNWIVNFDTIQLNNRTIESWVFYIKEYESAWSNASDFIKQSVHFNSKYIGEYPYPVVSVVQSILGFTGGMEYPTITNINSKYDISILKQLIKHEVGHNWFQAILASNERKFPWLDEGLNAYYDNRFLKANGESKDPFESAILGGIIKTKNDQPINTPSADFTSMNFSLFAYEKFANWLELIEQEVGEKTIDNIIQQYYNDWKFKHPQPQDFKKYFDSIPNFNSSYYFGLLDTTGFLEKKSSKPLQLNFFYNLDNQKHTNLFLSPIMGFNNYDKFMLGAAFHNYQIPNPDFNFFIAPLYSFSTKEVNGLSRLSYTFGRKHYGGKWLLAVDLAKFSQRVEIDSNQNKIAAQYYKIAPSIRYVIPNKSARSNITQFVEFKSFQIGEKGFKYNMSIDENYYPSLTKWSNRYVNRLTYNRSNDHVVNPNNLELQILQGKDFLRWSATYKGHFNYADKGYFSYRINFSAFNYLGGYTDQKFYNTQAFQPKLTANRGWDDFTYSHYFFGRNETEGLWSKQIFERDGFFKLRTDIFSDLQGRSDEWIASINLSSSIPKKILPLNFIRLFMDIGTYSETWNTDIPQPNILFVGGFQINVVRDVFEVYIPIMYSKVFRDNLKSLPQTKGVGKNISFNLNFNNIRSKRILKLPSLF